MILRGDSDATTCVLGVCIVYPVLLRVRWLAERRRVRGSAPTDQRRRCARRLDCVGGFTFHEEGDDSTARTLIRDYGWEVFEGHDGGPGGTLQIVDPSGAVVLIWAHNLFNGFILRDGWTGQTANGARIGTTLSEFNELHSEFTETSPGRLHFQSGTTQVTVTFEEELLSEIDVREY